MTLTLDQRIDEMRDDILRSLQELVRIPSVGGEPEGEAPFGREVQRALEKTLELSRELGFSAVNCGNMAGYTEYGFCNDGQRAEDGPEAENGQDADGCCAEGEESAKNQDGACTECITCIEGACDKGEPCTEGGQGGEMIAVLGHIDVVPAGDGWTRDPFGGEISDGKIWGRGTLDDKGAVVGALYGLKAIRESGVPLKRRIRVIFGTNEERGSSCIAYYNKVEEQPVAGFTPDADFPIIFAEKGSANTVHSLTLFNESANVPNIGRTGELTNGSVSEQADEPNGEPVSEPAGELTNKLINEPGKEALESLTLVSARGGTVANAVPGEATAVLASKDGHLEEARARLAEANALCEKVTVREEADGRFFVTAEGTSAHGSVPWLGENAVITLLEFLEKALEPGARRTMCEFLLKVLGRETDGASLGIRMEDSVSGGLTVNAGVFAFEDNTARVTLDIRYPVTKRLEDFAPTLEAAFAEGGFRTEITASKAPLYVKEDSRLIQCLQKVYREKTGQEPELLAIGGGTYAKAMKNIVAFGPLFPGEKDTAHQADEYMDIENLMTTVKIMSAAMVELAQ